jgi:hypothetical protein
MKLLLSILVASTSVFAQAPKYDLKTKAVLGGYEQLNSSCTESGTRRPCVLAEVVKTSTGLKLNLLDHDLSFPLTAENGRLTFDWENPENGDCDDPGCGNLLSLKGVVYPLKKGSNYVPALKVFKTEDYPFPEYEGDNEGEVKSVVNFVKR